MSDRKGFDEKRLFTIFADLISIDSESCHEGELRDYIQGFARRYGWEFHEDQVGVLTGGESGNLFIDVPGKGVEGLPPIVLSAHMDNVPPCNGVLLVDDGDRFRSGGDTVLGADCKAGVAAVLAAAEALHNSSSPHRSLQLVFSVQEEIGIVGALKMDTGLIKGRWGAVLDASGAIGGIVSRAPSREWFRVTVKGRAAHAGVEPEKGSNAIACAADAISSLELGKLDERTTANIGTIQGGRADNIVPDRCVVEGEVRSLDDRRLEEEKKRILDAFATAAARAGCEIAIETLRSFDSFSVSEDSTAIAFISEAMKKAGYEPFLVENRGGSDGNAFNREPGLEMVVLQVGMANPHSVKEYILKQDLVGITRVLIELARIAINEAPSRGPR